MNRLTKKFSNGYLPQYERETKENYYDLVYKLGQLEDIEEELGVDLITLFTALKKGVWYKDYKDNDKIKFTDDIEENMKCKELIVPAKYTIIGLKFRDYGETWVLDKE